jgi:hypothetical protein
MQSGAGSYSNYMEVEVQESNNQEEVTSAYPKNFTFEGKQYTYLAQGSFNVVYTYYEDGTWMVLKLQRDCDAKGIKFSDDTLKFDDPERAKRLWDAMNPDIFPPAKLITLPEGTTPNKGWACPYLTNQEASDREIYECVIGIFNRTGRIVMDAHRENFRKTLDDKVVCIDPGLVLQLEKRDIPFPTLARCKSKVSLLAKNLDKHVKLLEKLHTENKVSAKIPKIIKALIIIKKNRPDMINVDILKTDFTLLKTLAKAYDDKTQLPAALQSLDQSTTGSTHSEPAENKELFDESPSLSNINANVSSHLRDDSLRTVSFENPIEGEKASKETAVKNIEGPESQQFLTEENHVKKPRNSINRHPFFCIHLKTNWQDKINNCVRLLDCLHFRKTG